MIHIPLLLPLVTLFLTISNAHSNPLTKYSTQLEYIYHTCYQHFRQNPFSPHICYTSLLTSLSLQKNDSKDKKIDLGTFTEHYSSIACLLEREIESHKPYKGTFPYRFLFSTSGLRRFIAKQDLFLQRLLGVAPGQLSPANIASPLTPLAGAATSTTPPTGQTSPLASPSGPLNPSTGQQDPSLVAQIAQKHNNSPSVSPVDQSATSHQNSDPSSPTHQNPDQSTSSHQNSSLEAAHQEPGQLKGHQLLEDKSAHQNKDSTMDSHQELEQPSPQDLSHIDLTHHNPPPTDPNQSAIQGFENSQVLFDVSLLDPSSPEDVKSNPNPLHRRLKGSLPPSEPASPRFLSHTFSHQQQCKDAVEKSITKAYHTHQQGLVSPKDLIRHLYALLFFEQLLTPPSAYKLPIDPNVLYNSKATKEERNSIMEKLINANLDAQVSNFTKQYYTDKREEHLKLIESLKTFEDVRKKYMTYIATFMVYMRTYLDRMYMVGKVLRLLLLSSNREREMREMYVGVVDRYVVDFNLLRACVYHDDFFPLESHFEEGEMNVETVGAVLRDRVATDCGNTELFMAEQLNVMIRYFFAFENPFYDKANW